MSEMIEKLHELIKTDEKIISTKIKPLTAPGENYGSLMLSVDISFESREQTIVAKTLPPNQKMQEMFNCPVTFRTEIAIYKTIIPLLRSFQKEHGVENVINFTAKYYGSRPNLHGEDHQIDADAVLLLENLKLQGFDNLERTEGFDLEEAKLVLADLAHLHGVTIALKLEKPEVFKKEIISHLVGLSIPKEVRDDWERKYLNIIHDVPQLEPYLDRLKKVSVDIFPPLPPCEPWGTISHNDCWVNNIMVRRENGKPVESKLVDFQICDYASSAKDVLFFLFSSVQNHVLKEHYDYLVLFYHEVFIRVLKDLQCDLKPFSFEEFQKELDREAKRSQFAHTVLMLFPIFAPRGIITDMADLTPLDIGNMEPTSLHKEKLVFVVEEFTKRNWI